MDIGYHYTAGWKTRDPALMDAADVALQKVYRAERGMA